MKNYSKINQPYNVTTNFLMYLIGLSLLFSCTKSDNSSNSIKYTTLQSRNDNLALQADPETIEMVHEVYQFAKSLDKSNMEVYLNSILNHIRTNYGITDSLSIDNAVEAGLNMQFISGDNSSKLYFKNLLSKGEITKQEYRYLLKLDEAVAGKIHYEEIQNELNSILITVENDIRLNFEEKEFITKAINNLLFFYQTFDQSSQVRSLCSECSLKHKGKIVLVVSAGVALWLGCMVSTLGTGSAVCTALYVAFVALGIAAVLAANCWDECFGEHCNNPECPPNTASNDLGTRCCYNTPSLKGAHFRRGGFYYEKINGSCPYGAQIDLGEICFYGKIPEGFTPIITEDGKICVISKCP